MKTKTTIDYPQEKLRKLLLFINWNLPVARIPLKDFRERLEVLKEEACEEMLFFSDLLEEEECWEYWQWMALQVYEEDFYQYHRLMVKEKVLGRALTLSEQEEGAVLSGWGGKVRIPGDPEEKGFKLRSLAGSGKTEAFRSARFAHSLKSCLVAVDAVWNLLDCRYRDEEKEDCCGRGKRKYAHPALLRRDEAEFFKEILKIPQEGGEKACGGPNERLFCRAKAFGWELMDNFRCLPAGLSRPYLQEVLGLLKLVEKCWKGASDFPPSFPYPEAWKYKQQRRYFNQSRSEERNWYVGTLYEFLEFMIGECERLLGYQERFPYRYRLDDRRNLDRPQRVLQFLMDDPYFLRFYRDEPERVLEHIQRSEALPESFIREELDRLSNRQFWTDKDCENLEVVRRYKMRFTRWLELE